MTKKHKYSILIKHMEQILEHTETHNQINYSCYCLDSCYNLINEYIQNTYKLVSPSIQMHIYLFLQKYLKTDENANSKFLQFFYKPVWTITYHLIDRFIFEKYKTRILHHGSIIQGLSLLLHTLDDHLSDKEIPLNHTMLIYRTALWNDLLHHIDSLKKILNISTDILDKYIDRYSHGTSMHDDATSLGEYFHSFQLTMKMVCIAPHLILHANNLHKEDIKNILDSLYSFGLAWRIVDDIEDLKDDIENKKLTAPYFLLSKNIQATWINNNDSIALTEEILNTNVPKELQDYILVLSTFAINIANEYNLYDLAEEYSCFIKEV